MQQFSIIQYPDPILTQTSVPVEIFDATLAQRVKLLFETMYGSEAVYGCVAFALTAVQIGWLQRILVADFARYGMLPDTPYKLDGHTIAWDKLFPLVVINPEIQYLSEESEVRLDGCMSFVEIPDAMTERPRCVRIRYQDLTGAFHLLEAEGLLSHMIQHEMDHMNGIVWLQRMSPELLAETRTKYPHFFVQEGLSLINETDA